MTITNDKSVTLNFNGKFPKTGGTAVYWIDKKYVPDDTSVNFAIPHNDLSSQMIMTINGNGAIVIIANNDDVQNAFGSYSYAITV